MLRKKYQEKYILTKDSKTENIQEIEKEVESLFYLFEELREETDKQDKVVNTISEYITTLNEEIKVSENDVKDSKDIIDRFKEIKFAVAGMTLGSLVIIYNPYIAIGSILGGGVLGYIIKYYKKN